MRILRTASRTIVYDNGFAKEFCTRTLIRWKKKISSDLETSAPYQLIGNLNHEGPTNRNVTSRIRGGVILPRLRHEGFQFYFF